MSSSRQAARRTFATSSRHFEERAGNGSTAATPGPSRLARPIQRIAPAKHLAHLQSQQQRTELSAEDINSDHLLRSRRAKEGIPTGVIDHPYQPVKFDPDIPHPSYPRNQIINFRHDASKYPPAVQASRLHKLRTAKQMGIPASNLNKMGVIRNLPPPDVPVFLTHARSEKVAYTGGAGVSEEQREHFRDEPLPGIDDDSTNGVDWSQIEADSESSEGMYGRIVEIRRSEVRSLGVAFAPLMQSGKRRVLFLRSNGELWPISDFDVQYIMPASLAPRKMIDACWSPELLRLIGSGVDSGPEFDALLAPMLAARRQVVAILRKVSRETEKMSARMLSMGRGRGGGLEALWDVFAPQDGGIHGSITAAQAADYLLSEDGQPPYGIKPHTLPAFAAHTLMMDRPDLFLADPLNHKETATFMVRSRDSVRRLQAAKRIVNAQTPEDQQVLNGFVDRAKQILRVTADHDNTGPITPLTRDLPEFTETDQLLLHLLSLSAFEKRSIQPSHIGASLSKLASLIGLPELAIRGFELHALVRLGALSPFETTKRAEALETEVRALDLARVSRARPERGLLKGDELDSLRVDFTGQRVYVIDSATASELDDGLSLERIPNSDEVWVHVHVADPTRYIPFDSPMSERASVRGSSIYLSEGNIPLFEHDLIMRELSLGAKVERDGGAQGTMTFSARLSPSGELLEHKSQMGFIRDPVMLTYESVDKALGLNHASAWAPLGTPNKQTNDMRHDTVPVTQDSAEDLKLLLAFATAHRRRRLATCGWDWQSPEPTLSLVGQLPPSGANIFDSANIPRKPQSWSGLPMINFSVTNPSSGLSATTMVQEMMIMAGRIAAIFIADRSLPAPFRSMTSPRPVAIPGQPIVTLDDVLAQRDADMFVKKEDIARANFEPPQMALHPTPQPNWVMGYNDNIGYLKATSPLRRYEDCMVHWQIKSALVAEKGLSTSLAPVLTLDKVAQYGQRTAQAVRVNGRFGRFSDAWWQSQLFTSRLQNPKPDGYTYDSSFVDITRPVKGVVMGPTVYNSGGSSTTTPVHIPSLGLDVRCPQPASKLVPMAIGDEIMIRVTTAQTWPTPIIDVEVV